MSAGVGSLFGGGMNAIGDIMAGNDKAANLRADADIQRKNAARAQIAGDYQASRQQAVAGQKIGTAQADYAASGVTSNSGSVLDVLRQSHTNAELDRQNIIYGAAMKTYDFNQKAQTEDAAGDKAITDAKYSAFSEIFGGGMRGAAQSSGGGEGGYSSGGGGGANSQYYEGN